MTATDQLQVALNHMYSPTACLPHLLKQVAEFLRRRCDGIVDAIPRRSGLPRTAVIRCARRLHRRLAAMKPGKSCCTCVHTRVRLATC